MDTNQTQNQGQENMNMGSNMNMNQGAPTPDANQSGGGAMDHKGIAIVSRIPVLFWLPLVAGNKSPFAMFHANQGLLHLIAVFALTFILPFTFVLAFLIPFVHLASLVFMILGMIQASKGEMKPLPIIGGYKILN